MLFIAEKPDVAKAITKGIGTKFTSKDGYLTDGKNTVTWCFGHMLKLKEPEDYDSKYKSWNFTDIPFVFIPYERKTIKESSKQLKVVKDLIKDATIIVNAGDPDDEGQLLVDEILREVKNKKPVKRILINDNNVKIVQKALNNLEDNTLYEYMGYRAEARAVADQILGYNLSRSYSLLHEAKTGNRVTISIGRVQSAILGLIVRRDMQYKSHTSANFFNLLGSFVIDGTVFNAKFIPTSNQSLDEKNRLIDEKQVLDIAQYCKDRPATISFAETLDKNTTAPLPYNLIKLQQDCAKKLGFNPSKTLKVTQSLREKHQLITYNRSDCQYLSDEQHADASNVFKHVSANLKNTDTALCSAIESQTCNINIKNRAFDSSKVSAHHAIIPSENTVDFSKLSQDEIQVYKLIATAYIALFYPDYEYLQTKVTVDVDHHQFGVVSNIPTQQGWKVLFNDVDNDDLESDVVQTDLQQLKIGNLGVCSDTHVKREKTKPLPLYTMASLLSDLTKVAKYIKDPKLAKILKDRDKDKEGEHGGIGTPATRDSIINLLIARGFIIEDKKKVVSTELGNELYNQITDRIRYPDLTAIWTESFDKIKKPEDIISFIHFVMNEHIKPDVEQLRQEYIKIPKPDVISFPCPDCGRDMHLKDGKYGPYWGCVGYFDKKNQCKNMMKDNNGTPVPKAESHNSPSNEKDSFPCPDCGRDMHLKDGKYGPYWGCVGYFDKKNQCKNMMKDNNGTPVPKAESQTVRTIGTTVVKNDGNGFKEVSKTFITVPFAEKDEVKALGAKWDKDNKSWYVPEGVDQAKFAKWVK